MNLPSCRSSLHFSLMNTANLKFNFLFAYEKHRPRSLAAIEQKRRRKEKEKFDFFCLLLFSGICISIFAYNLIQSLK